MRSLLCVVSVILHVMMLDAHKNERLRTSLVHLFRVLGFYCDLGVTLVKKKKKIRVRGPTASAVFAATCMLCHLLRKKLLTFPYYKQ